MSSRLAALVLGAAEVIQFVFPSDEVGVQGTELIDAAEHLEGDGGEAAGVAALLTNDRPSVELVVGAIAADLPLISIPLPGRAEDPARYAGFVAEALAATGLSSVVARDDVAGLLADAGVPAIPHSALDTARPLTGRGAGFELVQFTSGSTGTPRPLRVPAEVLRRNLLAILDRVSPRSGDVTVSWLPLSHDMGLVGMVLASMAAVTGDWSTGGRIVLLEPEQFLRRPETWLAAMDHWRGTFTASPDFGLRLAARRLLPSGADLSSVRCAIVGGEIIRPSTLSAFEAHAAGAGWHPNALAPAYGMAELGLAATLTGPADRWRTGARGPDGMAQPAFEVAASGPPLAGYEVEVEAGTGRLTVVSTDTALDLGGDPVDGGSGRLRTNDIGTRSEDGWITVTGRVDDILVVHGRNVFAPTVDASIESVPGVRTGRATSTGLPSGEWVVVAEVGSSPGSEAQAAMRRDVRRAAVAACGAAPDHVVLVVPGSLPMTSSGKPQRAEVARRWTLGTLSALP